MRRRTSTEPDFEISVPTRSKRRRHMRVGFAGIVATLLLFAAGAAWAGNDQVFAGAPNGIVVVPGNVNYGIIFGPAFTAIQDQQLIGYMNVPPHQTALLLLRFSGFARCAQTGGSALGAGCEMQIWLDGQPVGPTVDNRVFHLESGQTATSGTFSIERVAPAVGPGKHVVRIAFATEQHPGCTVPCDEALRLDMSSWILTMERFRS